MWRGGTKIPVFSEAPKSEVSSSISAAGIAVPSNRKLLPFPSDHFGKYRKR